jgi:hypothetical protein
MFAAATQKYLSQQIRELFSAFGNGTGPEVPVNYTTMSQGCDVP